MGKKRSKTSKQKQVKAASKQFGVSIKKGSGGRERSAVALLENSQKIKQNFRKKASLETWRKQVKNHVTQPNNDKNRTKNDFEEQFKSLEARHQNDTSKQSSVKHTTLNLTPATFVVDDTEKSTQRLVQEATSKVQSLEGIGEKNMTSSLLQESTMFQPLQSSAAAAWTDVSPLESNNPYAVLHQADSDEEEEKSQSNPVLFQFAPPSFTVAQDDDPDL
jgi:hypothetical protein